MAIRADTAEVFTFFSIGIPPVSFQERARLCCWERGASMGGSRPKVLQLFPRGWLAQGLVAPGKRGGTGGVGHFPLLAPGLMMLPRPSQDKQTESDSPKQHRAGVSKASTAWGLRNVASNLQQQWASRKTPQCDRSSPPQHGSTGNEPNALGFNANCRFSLQEEINEPLWASDFSSLKLG